MLQLPKPALHAIEQVAAVHEATPFTFEQTWPQAPQWFTSTAVCTSQPSLGSLSQSDQPASHAASWQAPAAHTGVACGGAQPFPHAPQFFTSLPTETSH